MPVKHIVTGQQISPEKQAYAEHLRREMTPAERILWQRLRANRLEGYHFRRQQIIGPFIVDFYCHQANLVVEVDGGVHLQRVEYDAARDEYLKSCGMLVLRFTNREVERELEAVLEAILEECRGGPTPQPPS